jgi:hypothetical protein
MALGQPSNKWKEVYATTGTINTSDRRQKKDIRPFGEKFIKFSKLIKPVLYKFKDGTNGRDHGGYISQDIEKAMAKSGLESNDFAGFIKSPIYSKKGKIKGYEYGLRYSEFIALNTFMIQQLISRVEVLERMIKEGEKN